MKTTKELARELGVIRKRYISTSLAGNGSKSKQQKICSGQIFSYLIVLDFESTCWQDGKFRTQEIIEFPAVLCNTKTGQIESEFHYYVQPQEQPVLSDFCKQLTGISQEKVEQGIPLSLCLRKFTHWLNQIKREKNIIFGEGEGERATFVTWSDWDLGVCLLYEARRKQLTRPLEMNSWIDLRATYRKFYGRKPHGLNGALQDVGIEFEGREHSGVDDARNTARLAWRMMRDGCIMNVTKNINTGTASIETPPAENTGLRNILGKPGINVFSDMDSARVCDKVPPHSSSKVLRQSKLQPVKENQTRKENCQLPVKSSKSSGKSRGLTIRDSNKIPSSDSKMCLPTDGRKASPLCNPVTESGQSCSDSELKCQTSPSLNGIQLKLDSASESCCEKVLLHSSVLKTPSFSRTGSWEVSSTGFRTPNQSLNHKGQTSNTSDPPANLKTPNPNPAKFVFKTPSPLLQGLTTSNLTSSSSMKATPPMCKCGRRSKRRMVQSPGPNLGRFFFTCGVRTSQYDKNRGCDFFQWESSSVKGHNSKRHVSKTGNSVNASKPFTPVLNMNFGSKFSQPKRQLGVRSAVPKFIR